MTPETQKIIQAAEEKVKKKDMLKLSRLPPVQQEEAAHQLTAKEIHSVDEYHPTPAGKVYSTVRESVEDLKNPDKDRSRTTDTFLASLSLFLEKFCQDIKTYIGGEYESVFPVLTQGHLDQLRQSLCSVHAVLDNLFKEIERKSKNE